MDKCGGERNVDSQRGRDVSLNYHEPNLSSDWQVHGNDLLNPSIGMIPVGNSLVEPSCSSSAPMVNSFCPPIWDQNADGLSLGYCGVNVENDASASSGLGNVRTGVDWTSNVMFRGGMVPQSVPGMLPQSLPPHISADSAFIDRAARFSCFGGMMNPFGVLDPLSCQGLGPNQVPHEVFGAKPQAGVQLQQHEMNTTQVSNDALQPAKGESTVRCNKETKNGAAASSNESDEAGFSGRDAPEELNRVVGLSPGKGLGSKKRKRDGEGTEQYDNDEAQLSVDTEKDTSETKETDNQNSKPGGKHGKPGSSGPPKEEYIHVRARRGQATNSHSLAERVRREKISERMKFLQDLVPGCSKVTGKAVMLDEIINYVQSLQRQVEFLSMKLATVNPRLDFNIEQFLTKDSPQARAALSSSPVAFPPHITAPFPSLHPSVSGLIPAGFPGNSSEILRGQINLPPTPASGEFKDSTTQVPGVWEDELNNIVHMGINTSTSTSAHLITRDSSSSRPLDCMKSEL